MTSYTLGGVAGSAVGAQAYRLAGWNAVCAVCATCMAIGLATWTHDSIRTRHSN